MNRTVVRMLAGAGLVLAAVGAWTLGHDFMIRRLGLPEEPALARVRGRLRMASGQALGAGIGVQLAGSPSVRTDEHGAFDIAEPIAPGEHPLRVEIAPPRVVGLVPGLNQLELEVPDAFFLRVHPIWANTQQPLFDGARLDPMTLEVAAEVHFGGRPPFGVLRYDPATGTLGGWVSLGEGPLRVAIKLVRPPSRGIGAVDVAQRPAPGEVLHLELPVSATDHGRITAQVRTFTGAPSHLPMDVRLRRKPMQTTHPAQYARLGGGGELTLEFVEPGTYDLDVVAVPKSGHWVVTVEAGKTTDLGELTLPDK